MERISPCELPVLLRSEYSEELLFSLSCSRCCFFRFFSFLRSFRASFSLIELRFSSKASDCNLKIIYIAYSFT